MGMALFLFLLAYLVLVILPAAIAVLLLLWRSFRASYFWASGLFFTMIAIIVLPMLRLTMVPMESMPSREIGNFVSVILSPISFYLGGAAIASLVFSLCTFFMKRWHLLKGLVIGVCSASWVWLILMFRPA